MNDVAARLSQGAAAVATTATYVAACAATGRRAAGLDPRLVAQCYFAEEGLGLAALDADIAALTAAAAAADEALAIERQALESVGEAWSGQSGSAAAEFVADQCAGAAGVISALRAAAETLTWLRQTLATQVDHKVETAIRIDERSAAQRTAWLAAADAVLSGHPDETALQTITAGVAPYVGSDVATEWLAAMRSGTDRVSAAYRQATSRIEELASPAFQIAATPAVVAASSGPGPASALPPSPPASPSVSAPPAGGAPAGPPVLDMPAMPAVSGFPPSAGAPPDLPSSGPASTAPTEPVTPPARKRRRHRPLAADPEHPPADNADAAAPEEPGAAPKSLSPSASDPEPPVAPPATPTVAPPPEAPSPPPEAPAPLAAEAPDPARTPCEIAADALPQVGQ